MGPYSYPKLKVRKTAERARGDFKSFKSSPGIDRCTGSSLTCVCERATVGVRDGTRVGASEISSTLPPVWASCVNTSSVTVGCSSRFSASAEPYVTPRAEPLRPTSFVKDASTRSAAERSMMSRRPTSSAAVTMMPKMKGARKPNRSSRAPATGGPTRKLQRGQTWLGVEVWSGTHPSDMPIMASPSCSAKR